MNCNKITQKSRRERAKIRFLPGLCPGPRWGSSQRSQGPLVGWRGDTPPHTPLMRPLPRSPARSTPMTVTTVNDLRQAIARLERTLANQTSIGLPAWTVMSMTYTVAACCPIALLAAVCLLTYLIRSRRLERPGLT